MSKVQTIQRISNLFNIHVTYGVCQRHAHVLTAQKLIKLEIKHVRNSTKRARCAYTCTRRPYSLIRLIVSALLVRSSVINTQVHEYLGTCETSQLTANTW